MSNPIHLGSVWINECNSVVLEICRWGGEFKGLGSGNGEICNRRHTGNCGRKNGIAINS